MRTAKDLVGSPHFSFEINMNFSNIRNITISGRIGTGTTTLGKALAEKLGWEFVEGGEIFETIHKDLGIDQMDVLKRPDLYDEEFDARMKRLFSEKEHQIIESHLAGFNAKDVDGVFKIRLVCEDGGEDSLEERANRIAKRDGMTVEEAVEHIKARETGNVEKYQRMYGVNPYAQEELYDLTLNTFHNTQQAILVLAISALER